MSGGTWSDWMPVRGNEGRAVRPLTPLVRRVAISEKCCVRIAVGSLTGRKFSAVPVLSVGNTRETGCASGWSSFAPMLHRAYLHDPHVYTITDGSHPSRS